LAPDSSLEGRAALQRDDRAREEMPRYQFVTIFYQGFGLSFIAVLSQDVRPAS
jgi:hypothetical protein